MSNNLRGKPEYVENFMRFIARELREYMARLGVKTVDELVGCTDQLNRRGHSVTVFERSDRVGCLLMYGIPNMKLEKQVIERKVKIMEEEAIALYGHDPRIYESTVKEFVKDKDGSLKAVKLVNLSWEKDPESCRMNMREAARAVDESLLGYSNLVVQ